MKEFNLSDAESTWLTQTLGSLHLELESLTALKVEASHRAFYRVVTRTDSLILMVSPPTLEANDRFVHLRDAFASFGVPVPQLLASQTESGCFLLSDLGTTHLADTYDTPLQDAALNTAIDQLARVASTRHPEIEPYSRARLETEVEIFSEWFQVAYLGQSDSMPSRTYQLVLDDVDAQPRCCVHRDYHCRNLLFNDNRLGVVDFQDALLGPLLYDIASLLRDCYHVFDETTVTQGLQRFLKLEHARDFAAQHSFSEVMQQFDYTALQRQIKAIGIFARLFLRDEKSSHLPHIRPNLARVIGLTAKYADLSELKLQLNDCLNRYDAKHQA